jgi:hypothetical protein
LLQTKNPNRNARNGATQTNSSLVRKKLPNMIPRPNTTKRGLRVSLGTTNNSSASTTAKIVKLVYRLSRIMRVGMSDKFAIIRAKTIKLQTGGNPIRLSVPERVRTEATNTSASERVIGSPVIALIARKIGNPEPLARTYWL